MPWREASPMDQRTQFIADHLRDTHSVTELCECYGVSRKTGYKWIERYLRHGPAALPSQDSPIGVQFNWGADQAYSNVGQQWVPTFSP